MSWKLQIFDKEEGRWQDINQPGFIDITERRAQKLEEQYNKIPRRRYRAVPMQTPQEPLTETENGVEA